MGGGSMKLSYSIQPTSRTAMRFEVSDDRKPQLCRFDNQMMPVEEVVSILQCSGMPDGQIFEWLERRMQIGRFSGVIQ